MNIKKNKSGGIPFIKYNFNDENKEIIFLHANAFSPECYLPFFRALENEYNFVCPLFKPLWGNSKNFKFLKDWTPLKNDMIQFLKNYENKNHLIIGHSLGGHIAFRIALENESLVDKLILLDPIILPKLQKFIWQLIKWTSFGDRIHPMIKLSKNQKLIYKSKSSLIKRYRSKKIFKNINDENLKFLIDGLIKSDIDGTVKIKFPKDWEIQIYRSNGGLSDEKIWKNVKNLNRKILLIHADKTYLPEASTIRKLKSKSQNISTLLLENNSHLFPFEIPQKIANLIINFIYKNDR